jgi:hypothetical protein
MKHLLLSLLLITASAITGPPKKEVEANLLKKIEVFGRPCGSKKMKMGSPLQTEQRRLGHRLACWGDGDNQFAYDDSKACTMVCEDIKDLNSRVAVELAKRGWTHLEWRQTSNTRQSTHYPS